MVRVTPLLSTSGAVLAGLFSLGIGLAHASPGTGACLAECQRLPLSATNRASCRLDCENEAASDPALIRAQMAREAPARPVTPGPSSLAEPGPRRSLSGCKAGCDADRSLSVDDRASCKLDCEQEAMPDPGAPPSSPAARTAEVPAAPAATLTAVPQHAGFLARCHATCKKGTSQREIADFATCKLDCETMASVLDIARAWVPPAWLAAPARPRPTAVPAATVVPAAVAVPTTAVAPAPVSAAASADRCGSGLERCNAGCSKQEVACGRGCARSRQSETDRATCALTCETDREVCQGDCLSAHAICVNNQR